MTEPLGRRRWVIPEGMIPSQSTGPKPDLESHETDCASIIEADVPIVVQHTRRDSRQAELGLLSTMAYPAD